MRMVSLQCIHVPNLKGKVGVLWWFCTCKNFEQGFKCRDSYQLPLYMYIHYKLDGRFLALLWDMCVCPNSPSVGKGQAEHCENGKFIYMYSVGIFFSCLCTVHFKWMVNSAVLKTNHSHLF